MKKFLSLLSILTMMTIALTGCGSSSADSSTSNSSETKDKIVLGVRASSIEQAEIVKADMEKKGYQLEIVNFDDNIAPNQALTEGSIDANMYQHEPYLVNYNKSNNTDLVMVTPKISMPVFGLYSDKYDDYKKIPNGATLGVCNDATNQVRGLKLLNELGLIKLPADLEVPTILDLNGNSETNPNGYKFIEAEMINLPQSLKDVDGILLAGLHMYNAGLDGTKYLASASDGEDYAVGVVVKKGDETSKWATDLNDSFHTEDMKKFLESSTGGTTIPLF